MGGEPLAAEEGICILLRQEWPLLNPCGFVAHSNMRVKNFVKSFA